MQISIVTSTRSTKLYFTEFVSIIKDGHEIAKGSYKWSNRPWQSFDFSSALTKAINELNEYDLINSAQYTEIVGIILHSYSIESATPQIVDILLQAWLSPMEYANRPMSQRLDATEDFKSGIRKC